MKRALILAAATAAVVAAALPSAASAADFSVWACRDASGAPAPSSAWAPYGTVPNAATRTDTCASGGYLEVTMPDAADRPPGGTTGFKYVFPAGVTPIAYRIEMAGETSSPPGGTLFGIGLTVGGDPATEHITDGCQDDSATYCTFGSLTGAFDQAANVHSGTLAPGDGLAFSAVCIASTNCVPSDVVNTGRLYRSEVTFRDTADPTVGAVSLPATVTGHQRVTAVLRDVGSGVQRADLLVDGAVVDSITGDGDCVAPYTSPTPCLGAWNVAFDLDSTTLADGPHDVAVRVTDAAGNVTDGGTQPIDVSNPPVPPTIVAVPGPTRTVEVPVPATQEPSAQAPQADETETPKPVSVTLRAAAARSTLPLASALRGTATAADGSPKGGVQLTFERRPFGGDEDDWKTVGATTTAGDGSFRFPAVRQSGQVRVQPTLPTVGGRALIVGFVQPLEATLASSADTLANGDTVTLRGRIDGDGGAWAGRDVLIQAIVRGTWRTIDSAEVSDRGRVTWDYAFAHTQNTADYRFRLRLPAARGLPWKAVTTDPVSVLVKGG